MMKNNFAEALEGCIRSPLRLKHDAKLGQKANKAKTEHSDLSLFYCFQHPADFYWTQSQRDSNRHLIKKATTWENPPRPST